jgi:uncharacterized protein YjdB
MSTRRIHHFFSLPILLVLALLAACGDNIEPDDGVESLSISQSSATISVGMTLRVRLDAEFDDGTSRDVSNEATWTTSNAAVASVAGPAITAESQGTATITAAFGDQTATVAITVSAAALTGIQVTPGNAVTALGLTRQFTATGVFGDGTNRNITEQITWAATPGTIATITPTDLVTPVAVGTATITASSAGITASTTLRITAATLVSIEVSPASPTIADGTSVQLSATGVFSDSVNGSHVQDLTTQVTWTSSNVAIATVTDEALGSNGLVEAVTPGEVTITASLGTVSPITGTATVVVTDADLVSIAIEPAVVSLPDGATQQLTATGTFTDGPPQDVTSTVTWSSNAEAIATVSATGLITAVAPGTAVITASQGAATRTVAVTVTDAQLLRVEISPAELSLPQGAQQRLTATAIWTDGPRDLDAEATWTSLDEAIATVSNLDGERGLVRALATGTTTIRVVYVVGEVMVEDTLALTVSAAVLDHLEITAPATSLAAGTFLQLEATGVFTDDSRRPYTDIVVWSSSAEATATVSNADGDEGEVHGLVIGPVTITAATPGPGGADVTASVDLAVTAANLVSIAAVPATATIADGTTVRFSVLGTFTDGTTQTLDDVQWSSLDETIATVSNGDDDRGRATGQSPGTTTIRATRGELTADAAITVTGAVIESLAIAPTPIEVIEGLDLQLAAIATFDDATTQDIADLVTWESDDEAVATVSNGARDRGLLTGVVAGTTTIRAIFGDDLEVATATVTVVDATLVSIAITGADGATSIPLGRSLQLTASGTFNNGDVVDITDEVLWAPATGNVTVSNADGTEGLALAVTLGEQEVTATLGEIVGRLTLTAAEAAIEDFSLAAFATEVHVGEPLQIVATGELSNDTSAPVTERLAWTSSDPAIATVSDVAGSKGVVTGVAVGGPVTITATAGAITKTFVLTAVTAARPKLIINEVDYDMPVTPEHAMDSFEFVEIVNVGGAEASLNGLALAQINGAASGGAASYLVYDIAPATSLAPGQSLVIGSALLLATLPAEVPDSPTSIKRLPYAGATDQIQNGANDAMAIIRVDGTTCTLVDSLSYEGSVTTAAIAGCGTTDRFNLVEGTAAAAVDAGSPGSISRRNRVDTDNALFDWISLALPTPGV